MRQELTADELSAYDENGFLVIEDFLSTDELDEWREAVDRAVSARGQSFLPGASDAPVNELFSSDDPPPHLSPEAAEEWRFYRRVFTQRVNLWQSDERVRELVLDQRLGCVAGQLGGVDAIRIWHDQALIKEPFGNPTALHLDNPLWSFHDRRALTIWVALDDATVENGCMCYIPGSHKVCNFDRFSIGREIGAIFTVYPQLEPVGTVHCPVRAGGAVVHNGLTVHGAGANMTNGRRRAMTVQFMPDGAVFNGIQNILPTGYFESLSPGQVLDNDDQNPLVYARADSGGDG